MRRAIPAEIGEQTASALVALLHQGAPADEFARRLAEVESLADDHPGKSTLVEAVRMAMAVRNRLELQQQRERGMLAVIESAQDLSSRLDLTSLLSAIVSRARNLLRSDVAWLSTYDPERGEYEVLVGRRRAVAEHLAHGRAPRPRRRQRPDVDAAAVHDARLPARQALRARSQARRHLSRSKASPRWSACR